ncbi:hypothetical protein SAMN05660461_5351 [Chitinophaga ginsengisegetis]|uniref:Uncharacterized protein n=1 Tax=Chitinophaga ginsengisegetis TaxID=393003 RepID=A0A1T5P9V6_9BACT|nr:hypothetical protein [Chitinophaga ginsengisegetis]MDR6569013.1 hypothetical protein [Chitinophaga ginsengisegetis]MDR6648958.1 hypothetical protein [Chitinophaga ginsengisegetis]MDR6655094.1 hypothetical protein [Chitinophaga ginsengisegetis]SKD09462.1 hypothetical protein SAMN05660461_5351 [Chitinophaga ginsengisegetis]
MDKLTKLNAKKVESLETIKGGRLALDAITDLSDSGESAGTTIHTPTHYSGPDVYLCDHKRD